MKKTAPKRQAKAALPPHRNTAPPTEDSFALWVRHLLKSLLLTLGIGIASTLICSLGAYFYPDPNRLTLPLGLAASGLTAFLGGMITSRIHRHSALLCGLLSGSLFNALMMLLSLCFASEAQGYTALISALLHAGFLLLSVAGAYLGLPKSKKY